MEAVDRMIFFNSTVLVFWAVLFIPMILNAKKYWLLVLSGLVLVPLEIFLYWEVHDFPLNVLRGMFMFLLSLAGGYVMHHFNQKNEGDKQDERVECK